MKCGDRLEQPSTGRPRAYCGTACRRAAEFEIRRIARRLEGLEERAGSLRHEDDLIPARYRAKELAAAERRIEEAEERLRQLLAAGAEKESTQ